MGGFRLGVVHAKVGQILLNCNVFKVCILGFSLRGACLKGLAEPTPKELCLHNTFGVGRFRICLPILVFQSLAYYVQSPIGRITRPFAQHCSSLAHVVSEILPAPTAHMLGQAVVGASPNLGRTNII